MTGIPRGCVHNLLSDATCSRGHFRCDRQHRTKRRRNTDVHFFVSKEEYDWIKHAASLCDQTVTDFVKQAINSRLIQQGVDAVLLSVNAAKER